MSCQFAVQSISNKSRLDLIHKEIAKLEEMQRGYEAKALRYEMLANRLQFRSNQYLVAKQYWDLAQQNRSIAQKIGKKIDALQKEKKSLSNKITESKKSLVSRTTCEPYSC